MRVENLIQNPHLDGESFDWQAGQTGVVLVHGFTGTTTEVRPLAKALHNNGYSVSVPLLPGHGRAPTDMNACRWQDWAAAVDSAYRALAARCDRVVIGGESMGGLLALYAAIHHPEAPAVLAYAPALITNNAGEKALVRLMAPFVPFMQKQHGALTAADECWKGYDVNPLKAAVQLFQLQDEVRKNLAMLRRPLLIVQGRLDTTVSPLVPDLIAGSVRSTVKEVHWFENSTHCVLLDGEIEAVNALTLDFLARVLN